jgi:hypothetical protein
VVRQKAKHQGRVSDRSPYLGLTANQVVAFNLAQAREWRSWTQEEAAAALEPYLGVRWSKATFSQAERSVAGRFVRNFTADEIVAFARAFELPVTWFFMPPPPWAEPGTPTRLAAPDEEEFGVSIATLVDVVFGDAAQQGLLTLRLESFLEALGPDGLTEAQRRVAALVAHRVEAIVGESFRELGDWQRSLRAIASRLQQLERRAKRTVAQEVGVNPRSIRTPAETEDDPEADG